MGVWCYAKVYFVSGLHFCNPYREWPPVLLCFLRLFGLHFLTRELDAEIIEVGLQISYNLCNLPKQITTVNGKIVKYTYFADGTKFKAVDATGKSIIKPETRASIYYNSYGKTSYVELEEDIPPFIYK